MKVISICLMTPSVARTGQAEETHLMMMMAHINVLVDTLQTSDRCTNAIVETVLGLAILTANCVRNLTVNSIQFCYVYMEIMFCEL